MRPAFIINGTITGFERIIESIQQQFSDTEITIIPTRYAGHAGELASQFAAESFSHIISVGGDGTLHQVINGILASTKKFDGIVSVLPYGTGNDFARAKGFQKSVEHLKHKLLTKQFEYCDSGFIKFHDGEQEQTKYFVNIADTGLGAAVVQDMMHSGNNFGKKVQYTISVLKTFFKYKKQLIEIQTDDFVYKNKTMLAIVANSNFFGSGYHIAPMASTNNGALELIIIGDISIKDYLLNLPRLRKGLQIMHPQVHYHTFKTPITIKCANTIFTEADGELITSGTLQLGVIEKAFKLL
ncbi:MAG: YegS/Rv2252/BmrU family lipid kinase [Bacteroidetes bacterium]|nr:YegS/Rv2252/BmrU family lipid kinase [Bacteroidota bacterium]